MAPNLQPFSRKSNTLPTELPGLFINVIICHIYVICHVDYLVVPQKCCTLLIYNRVLRQYQVHWGMAILPLRFTEHIENYSNGIFMGMCENNRG